MKAKMSVAKEMFRGQPVVCVYVSGLIGDELSGVLEGLGYELVADVANTRRIRCSSPAELNSARDPLKKYFGANGELL